LRAVPILFAPLVGLALGAVLAWIAAPELGRDNGPIALSRPFAVVAAFAALLWLPVVDLGLVLLSAGAVLIGFCASVRPARKRRLGPVVAMVVIPAALAVAAFTLGAHRLGVSGTYAQFHGEFGTEPIAASTLGKGVLLMGAVLTLGLAWTVRSLASMGAEAWS
jgi:hypothetical protein